MNTFLISGATYSLRHAKAHEIISKYIDVKKHEIDLTVIETADGKKNISIDQIRDASADFFIKPVISDKKIIYIKEAQQMTIEAQNALLKTLEEPPVYGVFVLTANNKKNVLETILSRCASIELVATPRTDFNSAEHNSNAEEFIKALKSDIGYRLDWIASHKDNLKIDENFNGLIDSIESVLRDVALAKAHKAEGTVFLNVFQASEISKLAKFDAVDEHSIIKYIRALQKTKQVVERSNVNPSLALEGFMVSLPQFKV